MPDRHGPLRTGRFTVEIDEIEVPGWRKVELPSQRTEVGEYREGDEPDDQQQLWGATRIGTLSMERGVQPGDTRLWDWATDIRQGNVEDSLHDIAITLLDEEGEPQIRWDFLDAWLQYYEPPALDASEDGDIATERIVCSFDSMDRVNL